MAGSPVSAPRMPNLGENLVKGFLEKLQKARAEAPNNNNSVNSTLLARLAQDMAELSGHGCQLQPTLDALGLILTGLNDLRGQIEQPKGREEA